MNTKDLVTRAKAYPGATNANTHESQAARQAIAHNEQRPKIAVLPCDPSGLPADKRLATFPIKRAGDTYNDFAETEWLVQDILEANSLAELFADPESYKTFLAVGFACCIATGTPWNGLEVKQGGVLFVIGEGLRGINKRFKAWSHHNGIPLDDAPLYYSETSADFLSSASAMNVVNSIREALKNDESVDLVVIDTLARNMSGNESSPEDMAMFIGHIDRMVRAELGCTVLVIHHPGVHDKERGRGTNALRGAVDTDMRLHRPDREGLPNTVVMECMKQKNEERFDPMLLDFVLVDWGKKSSRGQPITSGVLKPSEHSLRDFSFKDHKIGKRARQALECLIQELERQKGADRISGQVWRDSCESNEIGKGIKKDFRKVFHVVKSELEKKRQIQYDSDGYVGIYPLKAVSL